MGRKVVRIKTGVNTIDKLPEISDLIWQDEDRMSGAPCILGTRVRVQVSRVDLDGRKIDFRMIREGDSERLLAAGRPDRTKAASAVEELTSVREADRTSKAIARDRKAASAKSSRKPGARKTVPRPRTRR